MQKTYNFYSDPGHGWVKVPLSVLSKLGIIDKITSFSYIRGNNAYLEEDEDASLFVNELKAMGVTPKFKDAYTNKYSKIRSYGTYTAEKARRALMAENPEKSAKAKGEYVAYICNHETETLIGIKENMTQIGAMRWLNQNYRLLMMDGRPVRGIEACSCHVSNFNRRILTYKR